MQPGRIYILINPCLPGLRKIGGTARTSEERAKEISGTGLPCPYEVAFEEEVPDWELAEELIHERLADYRDSPQREFFRLPLKLAQQQMALLAEELRAEHQKAIVAHIDAAGREEKVLPPTFTQRMIEAKERKAAAERAEREAAEKEAQRRVRDMRRVRSTQGITARCSGCRTEFSVTLQRGELDGVCPSCRRANPAQIEW